MSMTRSGRSSPNADTISVWNEILAPKFQRFRRVFVTSGEQHSRPALAAHGPRPGDRVLDVGCGFGETTIDLGRRVGPRGQVVGLDCVEGFLEVARKDAAEAGIDNVEFLCADAADHRFEPAFDLCFSRFGTMFFKNPVAALRNLRGALHAHGRLLMVVWRALKDNDCFRIPKEIALKHLPPPPDDGRKCGPGPFSMADEETVREMLRSAGYGEVRFERTDTRMMVGRTIDEAIDFQLTIGPAGEIVREAGAMGEQRRPELVGELREVLAGYLGPEGVSMPSSSWCITAARG